MSGAIKTGICVALAAGVLAGCGSSKTVTVTRTVSQTVTVTTPARTVTTRTVAPKPKPKPVATTQSTGQGQTIKDFNGNTLRVVPTLYDPATPDNSFADPPAGTRLVAVQLKLTSEGPGTISDDANNDATAIGSDGQDYTASFNSIDGCTNFSSGQFTITDGSTQVGCVVFQIPTGVKVTALQFALGGNTIQFNSG